jgi:hypothetical protein
MALGEELPSIEGEHERLVPLLFSIAVKLRARKGNPTRLKEKKEGKRDGSQRGMREIFIAREVLRRYGYRIDSHTSTQWRRFENHASCTGYSNGKANCTSCNTWRQDQLRHPISACRSIANLIRNQSCLI